MRILTFSTLYPTPHNPTTAPSCGRRCRAEIMRPSSWRRCRGFRPAIRSSGPYAAYARVPRVEERHGIQVLYPPYPVLLRTA
jgi:hypothetical protein